MSQEKSHILVRKSGKVSVVEFCDRKILDELAIHEIGEELFALADKNHAPRLLLNFNNVKHLSSAALGMLITLHKKVEQTGGTLVLCEIVPQIFEVFKITRLNQVFDIHDTEDAGLAAF